MKYRLLGDTGLFVSELCFGAMGFGGTGMWKNVGQTQQDKANQLVNRSLEAGINFFDTANVYSSGISEEMLGKALGPRRKDVILATKVRGRMGEGANDIGLSRVHIRQQVEASLRRMNTDYIDLYQIHGLDPYTSFEDTMHTLNDLVREGKVRYLGISNHMAWQIMKMQGIADKNGWEKFKSLQAYYSIGARDLEREVAPLLKDQNMGLMVWSPLAGGFLSGKYRRGKDPEGESRRKEFDFPPIDKEKAYDIIEVMEEIAGNHKASVAQIAQAWLLHQDVVTSIIIGTKRQEQLEDNLKAVDVSFTDDELQKLDEISQLKPEYPGWMTQFMQSDRNPNEREE